MARLTTFSRLLITLAIVAAIFFGVRYFFPNLGNSGGTDVGNAALAISSAFTNMGTLGGKHWFYEIEIPVSVFGAHWQGANPSETFDIQWTMLCANDIVALNVAASTVPEPAIPALVLAGLALAGLARRRHNA